MMHNDAGDIVEKCRHIRFRELPPEVIDRTKILIMDYLGVLLRGSTTESAACAQALSRRLNTGGGTQIAGTAIRCDPLLAALGNGIAAHSIECDDVVNAASLHPAVTVITSALSAVDLAGGCSGSDFIAAVVAGYEMAIRLGIAVDPASHYQRGFHPTATCGTFGAAMTAACILQLDDRQTSDAVGIAGSQAAGSMEYLTHGVYTKRFHAGWAAHSGLVAALLALEGFSGPQTIIQGRFGFLHGYSDNAHPERLHQAWQAPYKIMQTSIKPYACCRYNQGPIDCVLRIVGQNGLDVRDIDQIILGVLSAGTALVADPIEKKRRPTTIVDAQFSMPFGAAVAVLFNDASLDEYSLDNIRSGQVKALMQRVKCTTDPGLDQAFPERWPATAVIATMDGRTFEERIEFPKGDPENPLSRDELERKFKKMVAPVLVNEQAQALLDIAAALDEVDDVRRLTDLLSGSAVNAKIDSSAEKAGGA